MASAGYCQTNSLQITISADKKSYKQTEDISVSVVIKNPSDKERILFWIKENPHVGVIDNPIVIDGAILADIFWPLDPKHDNDVDALYIKPSSIIQKNLVIKNVLAPRRYQVRLLYRAPNILIRFITSSNQEIWNEAVDSNSVPIEVVA